MPTSIDYLNWKRCIWYVSGIMWLGVDSRVDTKKTCTLKILYYVLKTC